MTYYTNAKRATIGGIPCKVPKWYGELGNDKEFLEATKPRTAFKAAYYAGGHRMTIDGIPVRVAAYVSDWAPWMRRALGKGTGNAKEQAAVDAQMEILFPAFGLKKQLEKASGMATCLECRQEYYAREDGTGTCWREHEREQVAA